MTLPDQCGIDGCIRPLWDPLAAKREPHVVHRCALHEVASYNAAELREWGEENAADMVDIARSGLVVEQVALDETERKDDRA